MENTLDPGFGGQSTPETRGMPVEPQEKAVEPGENKAEQPAENKAEKPGRNK